MTTRTSGRSGALFAEGAAIATLGVHGSSDSKVSLVSPRMASDH
jgi:hypothetical protein